MERLMAAKLTRLTQKIEMLLNLMAEAALLAFLSPNGKFRNFWIHVHTHGRLHLACKRWTVTHSTSMSYVTVHGIMG
jgi:sarcosine oxidase delta subunit